MYNNPATPVFAAGVGGGLTYAGFESLYLAMGAFALVAAVSAVKRITAARALPSTSTFTVPSGSFSNCSTVATTPTS